jgi:peptidoglycan/xylan/chitin deacetylase (PgdA/CDA1 family)
VVAEQPPRRLRLFAADPDFEIASHSYAHRGFTAHCYRLDPEPTTDMAADVEHSFAVLHITQGHAPRTADALPAIIDGLRARGYRLVDLSDLLDARPAR